MEICQLSTRPWLMSIAMRCAPGRVRGALYYRWYYPRRQRYLSAYECAQLHYAPHIRMTLNPKDDFHADIALTGLYVSEIKMVEQVVKLARRGGRLIDVGANYGYYSLLWAGLAAQNTVIAFEPLPNNYLALRHNIDKNSLGDRVEAVQKAVSNINGHVTFWCPPEITTGGRIIVRPQAGQVEVEAVALDTFCSSDQVIDVLKIDAEGADALVLEGAKRLLERQQVLTVFFEHNKPNMRALGISEEAPFELLTSAGYTVKPIGETGGDVETYCAMSPSSPLRSHRGG